MPAPVHDAGASSFLYPFLAEGEHDLERVLDDVRRSIRLKAEETALLRAQTLGDGRDTLIAVGMELRERLDAGGTLFALGNGGSATDAMDAVADLREPLGELPARRAIDLTEDAAILTAIANDIGVDAIFRRQVIAHCHEGDALLAISTSGGSANVIEALAEARRRGLATIAMTGYDGGPIAADCLADHVLVTRSQHIPRIQEAQASAWHVLRELVEAVGVSSLARARVRARVEGVVQGVGFRPFVHRLAGEHTLDGWVRNDGRGLLLEVEGDGRALGRFLERLAEEAPPLAVVEQVRVEPLHRDRRAWLSDPRQRPHGRAGRAGLPRRCALPRLPRRAVRSRRPPLSLSVHQLHELRPALHDRPRRALRPAPDHDGGVRAVRGLPRRV